MLTSIQAERNNPCASVENKCKEGIQKTEQYLMKVKRGWEVLSRDDKVACVALGAGIALSGTAAALISPLGAGVCMGGAVFVGYKNMRRDSTMQALVKAAAVGTLYFTPFGGLLTGLWLEGDLLQTVAEEKDKRQRPRRRV